MTSIRLYNTLTRQKEALAPLAVNPETGEPLVRMYVCGPTVYDFAHIGNARPVIVFDVLFRLLRHLHGEKNVVYTRNITDVDDKINDRAARDFPGLALNDAIRRVTESTNAQFQADVKALGCLEPSHQPRATEHIGDMVAIIEKLIAKGFAYVAEGADGKEVLFSVTSMPRYGQLSNRKLEDQEAGARVAVEAHKRNPGDFVLWKQSSADQPGWDASFAGVSIFGRPGWHIECSAMSMAKLLEPYGGGLNCDDPLKNTFDIHGGGIDLVFPHHENEIAQSCCAFGAPGQPNPLMASIWMHNGFLQVEGQKMSKSLGNFVTIHELLATEKFGGQPWHGSVLRLAMLGTDYKQPIDWTLSLLENSRSELRGWIRSIEGLGGYDMAFEGHFMYELQDYFRFEDEIVEALSDDMNFPLALKELRKIAKFAADGSRADGIKLLSNLHALGFVNERKIHSIQGLVTGEFERLGMNVTIDDVRRYQILYSNGCHEAAHALFEKMSDSGVIVSIRERGMVAVGHGDGSEKVESLISARLAARAAKNFAESDRIRDELSAMGIQLKDGKDENGNPVTTWEVKR